MELSTTAFEETNDVATDEAEVTSYTDYFKNITSDDEEYEDYDIAYETTGVPDVISSFDFDTDEVGGFVGGVLAFFAMFFVALLFTIVIVYIYNAIALGKLLKKANHPNTWAGWVPVYNLWATAEIAGHPGWMGLIAALGSSVPVVGGIAALVVYIMILDKLSKSFGKDTGFTVGLFFLHPIFIGILAFGKAEYVGPYGNPETGNGNPTPEAKVVSEEPKEDDNKEVF